MTTIAVKAIAAKAARAFERIPAYWNHFSALERHQLVAALCFLIAVFYGLLIWQPGHKKFETLKYQEAKQIKRLRASQAAGDALKSIDLGNLDIQGIRNEFAKVTAAHQELEAERQRLTDRFIQVDDLESLQALKTELAQLAEMGDMEVTALEHYHGTGASSRSKRPLLRLKARASYKGLLQFLDGLATLSHVAAPVWSDITVRSGRPEPEQRSDQDIGIGGNTVRQWLEVEIHLAI
ncbi:MAG: hypothetical protein LBB76_00920 [Azoarcus sp.]|jgi:type II secretory pathway component PulM|nr:hypothetical protein [Azoarcus sp.]